MLLFVVVFVVFVVVVVVGGGGAVVVFVVFVVVVVGGGCGFLGKPLNAHTSTDGDSISFNNVCCTICFAIDIFQIKPRLVIL